LNRLGLRMARVSQQSVKTGPASRTWELDRGHRQEHIGVARSARSRSLARPHESFGGRARERTGLCARLAFQCEAVAHSHGSRFRPKLGPADVHWTRRCCAASVRRTARAAEQRTPDKPEETNSK
jgi:hypothetical protein